LIKFLRKIFIITLFLSINAIVSGQSKQELLELKSIFATNHPKETFAFAKKPNNEVEFVFSGLFLTYKYFISSQDVVACVFYPSCSVYAMMSIQQHGLIIGSLAAFDRLMRCNGLSPENYEIHADSHLLYDPVN